MRNYVFIDCATQGYTTLVALLALLFHSRTVPYWGLLILVHCVVALLVHALIQLHAGGRAPDWVSFLRHFYPVILYTGFYRETGALNQMFVHDYLDPVFIHLEDRIFHTQPSIVFMEMVPSLALSELMYASYFSYYVMIVGVGLALFLRNRTQFFHYVSVVSFAFYVCYLAYICLPVMGPRVFFRELGVYELPEAIQALVGTPSFPEAVRSGPFFKIMAFIYHHFEAPGAAFPSSHVAIAVCTLYFSWRYIPAIRWWHTVMASLLCISTVYCRYHYVVDVLAGLATAAVLIPLGNWLYGRFGKTSASAGAS